MRAALIRARGRTAGPAAARPKLDYKLNIFNQSAYLVYKWARLIIVCASGTPSGGSCLPHIKTIPAH
jgi:hypothetical protein